MTRQFKIMSKIKFSKGIFLYGSANPTSKQFYIKKNQKFGKIKKKKSSLLNGIFFLKSTMGKEPINY